METIISDNNIFSYQYLPVGFKIYHGSHKKTRSGIEPWGGERDTQNQYINEKFFPEQHGWFSNPSIAGHYSNRLGMIGAKHSDMDRIGSELCERSCIFCYTLNEPMKLIYMNDIFNLILIISWLQIKKLSNIINSINEAYEFSVEGYVDKIVQIFSSIDPRLQLYDIITDYVNKRGKYREDIFSTLRNIYYSIIKPKYEVELIRFSRMAIDNNIARYFKKNKPFSLYNGFGADEIKTNDPNVPFDNFHEEKVLFDTRRYLSRDLANPIDWQHSVALNPTFQQQYIHSLFSELQSYKTKNYNFYAGDLLDKSVWAVLHAEDYIKKINPNLTEDLKRIAVFLSFLHYTFVINISENKIFKYGKIKSHNIMPENFIDLPLACSHFGIDFNLFSQYANILLQYKNQDTYFNIINNPSIPDTYRIILTIVRYSYIGSHIGFGENSTLNIINSIINNTAITQQYKQNFNIKSIYFPFISNHPIKYPATKYKSNINKVAY